MQVPKRKKEEDNRALRQQDHYLTQEAITRMKTSIERLKQERPEALSELTRTREMGDLSENAAYQEAKYRVRRIDSRILSLEDRIKNAIPIEAGPDAEGRVRIGSHVKLRFGDRDVAYAIVGAQEADPMQKRISYLSPLGTLLIGKKAGEEVVLKTDRGETVYLIIDVT